MKMRTIVAGVTLALALTSVQADSVARASAVSVIGGLSVPVAVVSGVALGVAGSATVVAWSLESLSQVLSQWTVSELKPAGDNTLVVLQNTTTATERIQVTLPAKAAAGVAKGTVVQIEKKSTTTAVLQSKDGKAIAVLSDGTGARAYSAPRGPR